MQEQRSTVAPCTEAFELDHTSGSSSSAIGQQVYWSNVLNAGNVQTIPEYLRSPSGENMSLGSAISHETGNLGEWNLGSSSSGGPVLNQTNLNEAEMENRWSTSSANAGAGTILEERRVEAANLLSLDNVGINLNSNPVGQGQNFLQHSSSNDASQNSDHNARLTSNAGQFSQPSFCPLYDPFGPEVEQISSASGSTSACGNSTGGISYLPEDTDVRPGSSLDGRRLSGKRKNIESIPGQASGSGSHSCFQQTENDLLHNVSARNISSSSLNITRSSDYLSSVSPPEHLNPQYNSRSRAAASECLSSVGGAGSVEGSQRSLRVRINPAHQADSSALNSGALGTSSRHPSFWSPHQSSSLLIPLNQSLETRPMMPRTTSENQSHLSSVPGAPQIVHPLPWNGTSNSRIGGYSNSLALTSENSATSREEGSSRDTQRNNTSEHPIFFPADDVRNAAQGPTSWSLANDNVGFPGSMASTSRVGPSSSVHPSIPPTWLPHQNPPSQYPQTLSEFVRRAFPTSVSDTPGQLNNFLPHRPVHSSSSQEIAPPPGSVIRSHQQPFLRSAFLMDRRSDVTGASVRLRALAAAREGRSRMISEHIRNALDLMLRGENIRFEDVLILDQSVFYGVADLHDRHRDMRLDVDNMSYEELLALEEQIGNVSTGLSEEAILKHLKQRIHLSIAVAPSSEAEPCCICQEEYIDGEDLGTLDCGHDFHAACIKQWLMHKNLCPICKTTALIT